MKPYTQPLDKLPPQTWEPPLPGTVRIVLWKWPEGEILSCGAFSCVPRRDVGHSHEKHRFLADVPLALVHHFVGGACGAELWQPPETDDQ